MSAEDRIRAGNAVLVFDAPNGPTSRLLKLAEKAADHGIRCVVPVIAHVERLAHLRRKHGARYDADKIKRSLEDAGVIVLPIDDDAANAIVERLFEWFPTDDHWQDAKWKRLHRDKSRGKDDHPPATIDWFTAAMCPRDAIMVTDDKGREFQRCERITWDKLAKVLRDVAEP